MFNLRAFESITFSTTDFINRQIILQSASDNAEEEEWLESDLAFDLIYFMICDESKDSNSVFFHSLFMLTDVKAAWYAGQNKSKKSLFNIRESSWFLKIQSFRF